MLQSKGKCERIVTNVANDEVGNPGNPSGTHADSREEDNIPHDTHRYRHEDTSAAFTTGYMATTGCKRDRFPGLRCGCSSCEVSQSRAENERYATPNPGQTAPGQKHDSIVSDGAKGACRVYHSGGRPSTSRALNSEDTGQTCREKYKNTAGGITTDNGTYARTLRTTSTESEGSATTTYRFPRY